MTRPRRDPRADLEAAQVATVPRPRLDRAPRLSRRPRRDPRAELAGQVVAAPMRPRFDRAQRVPTVGLARAIEPRREAAVETRIIVLDAPAFWVAVVPDAPGGRLTLHDYQLFGAARLLAGRDGGVIVLGQTEVDDAGGAGADRASVLQDAPAHDPAILSAALAARLQALAARHILFPETPRGGDLARRVALALRAPLFTRCESLTATGVSRSSGGRRLEQRTAPTRLIALLPDAVAAYAGDPREARAMPDEPALDLQLASSLLGVEDLAADPASVPLALADFVTAAGNGVTDLDTFRRIVAALHATPGASRMLCDAGLMPRESQVGASGTVLAATCYLALGIAGAPQHLQGIADCQHVVAVNTDLHAAMIARAGLAIVQDAQLVMPALLDLLAREATS